MKALILILLLPMTCLASEMKIFSMNLHCGLGNWQERVDIVVGEILKLNPDVVGLQEVCYNDDMNMAVYIREKLVAGGFDIRSLKTIDTHKSFYKYQEQLLLISKHKADETKAGYLPSVTMLRNGYVSFRIGKLWFLTTHLHFALPMIRKNQYTSINKDFGKYPTVIFGDLNSNPADGETNVLKSAGWNSFFDGPSFPSDKPEKTFDGFWMSETFHEEVLATTIETHFVNAPVQPSDHLAVSLNILFR